MKNKYLLCASFLAHSAAFAADGASTLQPFYMINKTGHNINIDLTFSGDEKLKDLILTSGSSIQLHRNKQENSMEISGAILKDDAMTEVEGLKFGYIDELVEECLQGVIFTSNKDCLTDSPVSSMLTPPALALILSMSADHDDALKLDL